MILGVDIAPFQALVQGPGAALRIAAPLFIDEFEQSVVLQRYLYVLFSQIAQMAACNRFHVVEARRHHQRGQYATETQDHSLLTR